MTKKQEPGQGQDPIELTVVGDELVRVDNGAVGNAIASIDKCLAAHPAFRPPLVDPHPKKLSDHAREVFAAILRRKDGCE